MEIAKRLNELNQLSMSAGNCDPHQKCIRVYADEVLIKHCKQKIKAAESSFSRISQILRLSGNKLQLNILYLLEEEEGGLCVCDLSDILEMSTPAISQRLRKLKDANIIQPRKVEQTILYNGGTIGAY